MRKLNFLLAHVVPVAVSPESALPWGGSGLSTPLKAAVIVILEHLLYGGLFGFGLNISSGADWPLDWPRRRGVLGNPLSVGG